MTVNSHMLDILYVFNEAALVRKITLKEYRIASYLLSNHQKVCIKLGTSYMVFRISFKTIFVEKFLNSALRSIVLTWMC